MREKVSCFLVPPRLACLVAAALILFTACGRNASAVREQPIPVSSFSSDELNWPAKLEGAQPLQPGEVEVRKAVERVFGSDVEVENHAAFLAGDFNGDDSEDLVVAVRPIKEKLSQLNDQLANWTIQDPRHTYIRAVEKSVDRPPAAPVRQVIRPGERLLAVLHGYSAAGWRNPMARQAYLLRGACGQALRLQQPSPALLRDFGSFPSRRDVIEEQLGEVKGVLYWTGAAYAWHAEK
jgi:hypothetical protein